MVFENRVENIQDMAYNDARTVYVFATIAHFHKIKLVICYEVL